MTFAHGVIVATCLLAGAAVGERLPTSAVTIALGNNGLRSLRYQGAEFLGDGTFRVSAIVSQAPGRAPVRQSIAGNCSPDYQRSQIACSYRWGKAVVEYRTIGSQFRFRIVLTNSLSEPITGVFLEPFSIRLPSKPAEYDGNTPILSSNIGEPTVLKLSFGANALVLVDEGSQPLLSGFPFAADRPASMRLFPVRLNTGTDPTYPTFLPKIVRPIQPGRSDSYECSIRFGPAGLSAYDFAPDRYRRFAAEQPAVVKWADRRPIASLILGSTAAGWPGNPRGWLLDPSIDVHSAPGVRALRARILEWADRSIAIMRRLNAQGMITWDIEGEQYPQPTTYIGDPRVTEKLAPEMSGVADDYFERFRRAGFRVGVCIRPQSLQLKDGSAEQTEALDPAGLLLAKIAYAKQRWGATLFYVDSNGGPNDPMPAAIFRKVAESQPDVLLIPEHADLAYYGAAAPYRELRAGWTGALPLARQVYPQAFAVINTADGDVKGHLEDMRQSVAAGDVLLFRGWFDDPANALVRALAAHAPRPR